MPLTFQNKVLYPSGFVPESGTPQPFHYNAQHDAGFMQARMYCRNPRDPPFQDYAFQQTSYLPSMGCGGADGIAQQVDIETSLREQMTKDPQSCRTYEYRDWLLTPLLSNWQQPDYRPLYYTSDSRQEIKSAGRAPDVAHSGKCSYDAPNAWISGAAPGPYGNWKAYEPASCEGWGAVSKTV